MPLSPSESTRYSRHLLLEQVGTEGQERLKQSSVLCIGAGGLGCPVLMYLAAAGVGRIGIVDFDVVDHSNLQRQILYGSATVGTPKALAAKARLADLNPHCKVETFGVALTRDNALDLLAGFDVIVDGTDNFATRYLVNDACELLGKPLVYGSIFKFEGQASLFNHQGGPTYRDLYPKPPPPEMVPSCAEGGVLGVLPGIIGSIQATETLKVLLGIGNTLSGRLLLYNALDMSFQEMKLQPRPGREAVTELIDYQQFCGFPAVGAFDRIAASEAKQRLADGWDPYIIDVRTAPEELNGQVPGTHRLIPHDEIGECLDELPRDRDILLYCKMGGRSGLAAGILVAAGFEAVANLEGGMDAWGGHG